jgi:hypothetical protein
LVFGGNVTNDTGELFDDSRLLMLKLIISVIFIDITISQLEIFQKRNNNEGQLP